MLSAQSGRGPGHATTIMIYVKSFTESKRMEFNLALWTEIHQRPGTCCSNRQYGLQCALKVSRWPLDSCL